MFRQGQLASHGLAILLGINEAGISNRGKKFLHHVLHSAVFCCKGGLWFREINWFLPSLREQEPISLKNHESRVSFSAQSLKKHFGLKVAHSNEDQADLICS